MKYYNVCWNEIKMYECKADNKDDTEISFRINVSSNVRRYKILKIMEMMQNMRQSSI